MHTRKILSVLFILSFYSFLFSKNFESKESMELIPLVIVTADDLKLTSCKLLGQAKLDEYWIHYELGKIDSMLLIVDSLNNTLIHVSDKSLRTRIDFRKTATQYHANKLLIDWEKSYPMHALIKKQIANLNSNYCSLKAAHNKLAGAQVILGSISLVLSSIWLLEDDKLSVGPVASGIVSASLIISGIFCFDF